MYLYIYTYTRIHIYIIDLNILFIYLFISLFFIRLSIYLLIFLWYDIIHMTTIYPLQPWRTSRALSSGAFAARGRSGRCCGGGAAAPGASASACRAPPGDPGNHHRFTIKDDPCMAH